MLGKKDLGLSERKIDAAGFSGHKIGAPAGIGALWLKDGNAQGAESKNAQERGRRPGTESLLAAIGFGAQAKDSLQRLKRGHEWHAHRLRIEERLMGLGFSAAHGSFVDRIENTINIRHPGVRSDIWIPALDLAGFALSAGAACSSGDLKPSSVLMAMGIAEEQALEAIRISMGPQTTTNEIDSLVECIEELLPRLIEFGS